MQHVVCYLSPGQVFLKRLQSQKVCFAICFDRRSLSPDYFRKLVTVDGPFMMRASDQTEVFVIVESCPDILNIWILKGNTIFVPLWLTESIFVMVWPAAMHGTAPLCFLRWLSKVETPAAPAIHVCFLFCEAVTWHILQCLSLHGVRVMLLNKTFS